MSDTAVPPRPERLASLDAYRGLVMLLMMGEALRFCAVAAARPASAFWAFLCHHQDHVAWVGGSLHDMIQPSFSFLVGAALPFSLASRAGAGQSRRRLVAHAFVRAFVLVVLGILLRSLDKRLVYFTFEDTLTQIGLGYGFLFLIGLRPRRDHWTALGLVLLAYGVAFALYPAPGPEFDWGAVGVAADWPHHQSGFAAHWDKNSNLGWAFDTWFLNLFPRPRAFLYNDGGYATLSFIPTLGTMILGLLAGGVLRNDQPKAARVRWLLVAGAVFIALGWLLGITGACPVVKRIWTPSFAMWSGGICFWLLAFFYGVIDVRGHRRWAFPMVVVGMNSIFAYVADHVIAEIVERNPGAHLGGAPDPYALLLQGGIVLVLFWSLLFWMWKRRIFLRI